MRSKGLRLDTRIAMHLVELYDRSPSVRVQIGYQDPELKRLIEKLKAASERQEDTKR